MRPVLRVESKYMHAREAHMGRILDGLKRFIGWMLMTEERRFILVGGTIAIVQNIILIAFVLLGNEKVLVNRYLQPIALIISFFPHREITWRDKKGNPFRDAFWYYASRIIIMLFNTWCFERLITVAEDWYAVFNPSLLIGEAFLNLIAGKLIYGKKKEHLEA